MDPVTTRSFPINGEGLPVTGVHCTENEKGKIGYNRGLEYLFFFFFLQKEEFKL